MSCKVIRIQATDWPGSHAARIHELPGFTHYLVSKKTVEKVKKMLEQSRVALEDAHAAEDGHAIADIVGEIHGMKYTLQTLGIPLK